MTDSQENTDALIATSPVDEPHITVDREQNELTVLIEGKKKPLLPAPVIAALVIWCASAFICPGVLILSLILIPILLIAAAVMYFIRPGIFKRPVDSESMMITDDEIVFSNPEHITPDDEVPALTMPLTKLDRIELESDDDAPVRLAFIDDEGEQHLLGDSLDSLQSTSDDDSTDDATRELEWLADVVESHLDTVDG